jgi:hypothetical protein
MVNRWVLVEGYLTLDCAVRGADMRFISRPDGSINDAQQTETIVGFVYIYEKGSDISSLSLSTIITNYPNFFTSKFTY